MSESRPTSGRITAESVSELFARYLDRQIDAQAEGLGFAPATDEVEPYDSVPVQPIDPRLAWDEARGVLRAFAGPVPGAVKAPLEWPQLVLACEPAVALAFALGNYPQLVRDLHPLLAGGNPSSWRPRPGGGLASQALLDWARHQPGSYPRLLAGGVLRLARAYDQAEEFLQEAPAESQWQAVWENEKAALAWHRGQAEQALALWQGQAESVPVLFNRGMASLFLGRTREARAFLSQAVAVLPESSSWHHLGQLYLALC